MKSILFRLSVCAAALMSCLVSCKDNDPSVGISIRPQQDQIIVASDTFHVKTEEIFLPPVSAQTDSMMLGEFYSPTFGTTKAELLVQLTPPVGYEFPGEEYNPQPDSLVMLMGYRSWFGVDNAPIEISIYEMNRNTIDYNTRYLSDVDPGQFTDSTILMGRRIVTSVDLTVPDSVREDEDYYPTIRYKFSDEQLQRFFDIPEPAYSDLNSFCEEFKGMYITTQYGVSTMFYLDAIEMRLYYHYTYDKNGKDTVVNTSITYPANKEVRQLNRLIHPDLEQVVVHNDSICNVKSAGGIYPKVTIPIGRIRQRMYEKIGDKLINVNSAIMYIERADIDLLGDPDLGTPAYLMAITADKYDDFIKHYDVPQQADSTSVIASFGISSMSYDMDISYYLVKHLRNESFDPDEEIEVYLVPVDVTMETGSNSSSTISSIRPLSKLAGVQLRSGTNGYSPMRIQVLYSGF